MKNIRKLHAANDITVIITISHEFCVAECAVIRNEPVRRRNQQLAPIDPHSLPPVTDLTPPTGLRAGVGIAIVNKSAIDFPAPVPDPRRPNDNDDYTDDYETIVRARAVCVCMCVPHL